MKSFMSCVSQVDTLYPSASDLLRDFPFQSSRISRLSGSEHRLGKSHFARCCFLRYSPCLFSEFDGRSE